MASTSNGVSPGASPRKSVIVTGGASGIGLALVEHFASQGHRVAILDINLETGTELAASISSRYPKATITFKRCDVSSWEDQSIAFKETYVEHDSQLDIIIANAGISEQGSTSLASINEETPSKPSLKTLDVNLSGVVYSVKLATHYMSRKKSSSETSSNGLIVCTASNAGLYPFPVAPLYSASKAGVIGLVRSTAKVLEPLQIQINALAPAVLETNIAPSKALFKNMIITPMSTLIEGVRQFVNNPKLTGEIAEIHGNNVTIRPHHEYVDEDSKRNLENFWSLGYA